MMEKVKPIPKIILFVTCLIIIAFSSCSDDFVTNNENPVVFDTVETYDWKADTIRQYYLSSFDVVDSNNIYFTANPSSSILHYDGINYNPIDLQDPIFRASTIEAWDNNNIFVGGGRSTGSWSPAALKIIRNGVVYSYEMPDDSTVTISSIYLTDENSAWIGSQENNIVYFFEDGHFTTYRLGENESTNFFLKDPNGVLFLFSLKYVNLNLNGRAIILYIRKLIDKKFIITKIDSSFSSSGKLENFQNCTNGDIIISGRSSIYSFEHENFLSMYTSSSMIFGIAIGGLSKSKLIVDRNYQLDFPERNAYIWNGEKIMIEKNLKFNYYSNVHKMVFLNDKVYITTSSGFSLPSTFIIGSKK